MNQFVTIAIAEKIALLNALDYLGKRAKRGSREKLLSVLAKSPDVEPVIDCNPFCVTEQ